jgi:hypothetical protein
MTTKRLKHAYYIQRENNFYETLQFIARWHGLPIDIHIKFIITTWVVYRHAYIHTYYVNNYAPFYMIMIIFSPANRQHEGMYTKLSSMMVHCLKTMCYKDYSLCTQKKTSGIALGHLIVFYHECIVTVLILHLWLMFKQIVDVHV